MLNNYLSLWIIQFSSSASVQNYRFNVLSNFSGGLKKHMGLGAVSSTFDNGHYTINDESLT